MLGARTLRGGFLIVMGSGGARYLCITPFVRMWGLGQDATRTRRRAWLADVYSLNTDVRPLRPPGERDVRR
jgi:hypothetical protein